MGGAAKTVGRAASGVLTLGGSEIARNNLGQNNILSKVLQTPGMILTGGQSGGYSNAPSGVGGSGTPSDPFGIDPATIAADQKSINDLGQSQYDQTLAGINGVGAANTQRAKDLFGLMLPNIAENSQAAHLYDSTGYGQEVGRQQSEIASQIANQEAQQKLSALQPLQQMQQSALGRGFSLNDFIRQANVAKSIGSQVAPQVGNGKGQTGTALAGAGGAANGLAGLLKLGGKAAGTAAGGPVGGAVGTTAGDALSQLANIG